RRRHTRSDRDWSSDVCSSDLIWADTQPKSPHRGNLYNAWIEWQIEQSIVLFSRSTDAGRTWSKPMRISTRAGWPRDDNGAVVGRSEERRVGKEGRSGEPRAGE